MHWFYIYPFQRILLTNLLLTYLLHQFMVPVKYSFKNRLFYVNGSKFWQRPCSLDMRHCTSSRAGNTSLIGPDLNSSDLNVPGILEDIAANLLVAGKAILTEHLAWHGPPHYDNAVNEGRRHSKACMRANVDTWTFIVLTVLISIQL